MAGLLPPTDTRGLRRPSSDSPPQTGDCHLCGMPLPWRAPHRKWVITSAGLLAHGSSLGPAFPPLMRQWHLGASLAAYSCGGSRSFALRSLFIRCRNIGTEA